MSKINADNRFVLPVANVSMTPMHKVEAIAASTAFPPFFKTLYRQTQMSTFKCIRFIYLLSTPILEHCSASTATAPFVPFAICPTNSTGLSN